jgi:hypothetical protein
MQKKTKRKKRHAIELVINRELRDRRRTCDGLYVHFDIIRRNYLQQGRDDTLLARKLSCDKDKVN